MTWRDTRNWDGIYTNMVNILHKLYTPYMNQFVTNIIDNQQIPEMSTLLVWYINDNIWRLFPLDFLYLDSFNTTVWASILPILRTWDVNDSIKHLSPASVSAWPLIGQDWASARSYWLTPPCVPSVMFTPPLPRHQPTSQTDHKCLHRTSPYELKNCT